MLTERAVSESEPRVLFVSKPIAPPWNDAAKNLVRDVAAHLTRARATVMSTPGAQSLGPRVTIEHVHREPGRLASVTANARVARRLATGDPHDVWHFFVTPNAVSATVARTAWRARRALGWNGKVVQTIVRPPRSFDGAPTWIFGDVVVALSQHTRGRLVGAGVSADRIRVIPPCARSPAPRPHTLGARMKVGVPEGPIVLYPGDYDVSTGAQTVAAAAKAILDAEPRATIVFACKKKSPEADEAQRAVEKELARAGIANRTKHVGEVSFMDELLGISSVVVFPVDDLDGKVDLPLVLLETMALGVPMVLARGGTLEALECARFVDAADADALAKHVVELLRDQEAARRLGAEAKRIHRERYAPEIAAAAYDDLYATLR
jgi:glycosyltransferase involved in cell wall biosynthesis